MNNLTEEERSSVYWLMGATGFQCTLEDAILAVQQATAFMQTGITMPGPGLTSPIIQQTRQIDSALALQRRTREIPFYEQDPTPYYSITTVDTVLVEENNGEPDRLDDSSSDNETNHSTEASIDMGGLGGMGGLDGLNGLGGMDGLSGMDILSRIGMGGLSGMGGLNGMPMGGMGGLSDINILSGIGMGGLGGIGAIGGIDNIETYNNLVTDFARATCGISHYSFKIDPCKPDRQYQPVEFLHRDTLIKVTILPKSAIFDQVKNQTDWMLRSRHPRINAAQILLSSKVLHFQIEYAYSCRLYIAWKLLCDSLTECMICYDCQYNVRTQSLPCGHIMCQNCFKTILGKVADGWNQTFSDYANYYENCPMCRTRLDVSFLSEMMVKYKIKVGSSSQLKSPIHTIRRFIRRYDERQDERHDEIFLNERFPIIREVE